MKKYEVIAVGSGSAMNIVDPMLQNDQNLKFAVIDKDEPGGICLTRGCIPSKILLYPADVLRTIERAHEFGIEVEITNVDFAKVMKRMRTLIDHDINMIREGLSNSPNVDYYHAPAKFVDKYTMQVGGETIKGKMIFLCTGSKVLILPIIGLKEVGYHTSDTILHITRLPESIAIVGGGYIAAEYGHFLSSMGSKVTIIGRNKVFLPNEEPEISALVTRELGKHLTILTNQEVREARKTPQGKKQLISVNRENSEQTTITVDEIMIAAGRGPNTDILDPEKGGVRIDQKGWIIVNEYLETSQPNVWAFGDAIGRYLFKHAANGESMIVYQNAVTKRHVAMDYHAIPHAVFTYPEIAAVGLGEKSAVEKHGEDNVLIGFYRYENTAKGEAMNVKDYFVKVILERQNFKILGAHIIGPFASILIQEIINLMYTSDQSARPMFDAMHIHPALNEVVQRAFNSLMTPDQYQHEMTHYHE
ncbi:MAG: dihydrolipoyl dehydrogenase [Candidatus Bathyarchaeia archaeon]|jgi:dihydrolipoamide dehydrogenase